MKCRDEKQRRKTEHGGGGNVIAALLQAACLKTWNATRESSAQNNRKVTRLRLSFVDVVGKSGA